MAMESDRQQSWHIGSRRTARAVGLSVGDRIRITAGGKTRDGNHRLSNGRS